LINNKAIIIITTSDNKDELVKLSDYVLDKKLAGCTQIVGPIISKYWWEGKIEKSDEYLLLIKTLTERFEDIRKIITDMHSYSTPEIIGIEIDNISEQYYKWLISIVKG